MQSSARALQSCEAVREAEKGQNRPDEALKRPWGHTRSPAIHRTGRGTGMLQGRLD